ncbi:hypothetical protein BJ875DRAFT_469197 [Amylocarpus encephaloides]|uniref:Uncharacterized protein n=1 Tax=Amylocarpus encephaloides TaxID=45428 RepID=A0A9P8C303_9HELO|nr:hypothetical protein BJ875DRAFT_469197 [Amylocarpus encephaloides]
MFQHEDLQKLLAQMNIVSHPIYSYAHYHRGSLAMLLKLIKGKVRVDWGAMMNSFLTLVKDDTTISMG